MICIMKIHSSFENKVSIENQGHTLIEIKRPQEPQAVLSNLGMLHLSSNFLINH